jgi:hypothetical protein
MDSLVEYYLHQGGGGGGSEYQDDLFGPVYVGSSYLQRGLGIGSLLAGIFRTLKSLTIRGDRALGREALDMGAQILADIKIKQPETKIKDIVADRLVESAQRLVIKLKGSGGRKRKRETSKPPSSKKKKMKAPTKRRESIKGTYSPNRSHSTSGRNGVRNDKIRVRHIRREACADRCAIVTSHTLQTQCACGSMRSRVRHTWRCLDVLGSRHSHVGAGKTSGARRFGAGPCRQHYGGQQSTPLTLQSMQRTVNGVSASSCKDLYNYRAYLNTLLTYGHDASQSRLTCAFWYPDGDFQPTTRPTTPRIAAIRPGGSLRIIVPNSKCRGVFMATCLTYLDCFWPGYNFRLNSRNSRATFTS